MFLATLFIPSLFLAHVSSGNPLSTDRTLSERDATAAWTYIGTTGPLGWAGMQHKYSVCSTGQNQSPINFDSSSKLSDTRPEFSASSASAMPCMWNGHTFKVTMTESKMLTKYGGQDYTLDQFHFHTPSEHFIKGEYFPLEMHMVHTGSGGNKLVLGILFGLTKTQSNPVVSKAILNIDKAVQGTKTGPLDFSSIVKLFKTSDLYQYKGSFTRPPCTEGVTWVVASATLNVDLDDWHKLKKLMKFNARHTQNVPGQTNLIELAAKQINPSCTTNNQR